MTSAHPKQFNELMGELARFQLSVQDILKGGGNKSNVAKKLEGILHPLGWNETRISGDLIVEKTSKPLSNLRSRKFDQVVDRKILKKFLDGHQVDFVKNEVAFDLEWNSKDQTFDRDLYALRAFYECGIVDVGIILTRSTNLKKMFADIAGRVKSEKDFKAKYGASTTWMGKLDYRVNAGRAGGCPILAIGFKEPVFTDIKVWRDENPLLGDPVSEDSLIADEDQ